MADRPPRIDRPPPAVVDAVREMLVVTPSRWELRSGGHTLTGKARALLPDGSSAFVKWAEGDASAALLDEIRVVSVMRGPFLPLAIAWAADDPAILVMEDLSAARWPPPYPDDIDPLWAALEAKAAAAPPAGLPRLEDWPGSQHRWRRVAADPQPFLGLGVVTSAWLDAHLEDLIAAEESVTLAGTQLVHNDVFSGNVAFLGGRAILVDWATAAVGNALFDTAMAVLSLRSEGSPVARLGFAGEPGFASMLAGHNALEAPAPLPNWARPDSTMRAEQLWDLRHALDWIADVMELPPPDGPATRRPV